MCTRILYVSILTWENFQGWYIGFFLFTQGITDVRNSFLNSQSSRHTKTLNSFNWLIFSCHLRAYSKNINQIILLNQSSNLFDEIANHSQQSAFCSCFPGMANFFSFFSGLLELTFELYQEDRAEVRTPGLWKSKCICLYVCESKAMTEWIHVTVSIPRVFHIFYFIFLFHRLGVGGSANLQEG